MHPLHPLTKLYLTISLIILSFVLELELQIYLVAGIILVVLSISQRWNILRRFIRFVVPLVVAILLLNIFFFPESQRTITVLGANVNEDGLRFGLNISLRLSILSLSLLFLFTSTPAHLLASALLIKGVGPRIVYVFLHSLQLIEGLRSKIDKISIAQASRGLTTQGNLIKKVRGFFPLLLPLIFTYLSESLERGLALELRGLGIRGSKSFFTEIKESTFERASNWIIGLATAAVLIWKILK